MTAPTTRETADHAELARLAEAAGGEAWSLNDWRPEGEILVCGGDGSEYGLFATVNDDLPEVAAFIAAANPATVLSLLSEIAALRDYGRDVAKEALEYRRQRDEAVGLLRLVDTQARVGHGGKPVMRSSRINLPATLWHQVRAFLATQEPDQ